MSSKIKDGLFMGDVDAAQDAEFLQLNGIVHIVNCVPRHVSNVFQSSQALGVSYMTCDLDDVLRRPLFDLTNREFMSFVQLVDRSLERTESVLVHSLHGVNRSPSLLIGYLMVTYCWGVDKAYDFITTKRTDVTLDSSYAEQLCALESQLQLKYPARATEQQLYEWDPASANTATDELVLVHTYLNATAKTSATGVDHQRKRSAVRGSRRLFWIDQCAQLKKQHSSQVLTLERPPNHSYSEMYPNNGWVDVVNPNNRPPAVISLPAERDELIFQKNPKSLLQQTTTAGRDRSGDTTSNLLSNSRDPYSSDTASTSTRSFLVASQQATAGTDADSNDRPHSSFSVPPTASKTNPEAPVPPQSPASSSDRDELEVTYEYPGASKFPKPRYLQETLASINARPRKLSTRVSSRRASSSYAAPGTKSTTATLLPTGTSHMFTKTITADMKSASIRRATDNSSSSMAPAQKPLASRAPRASSAPSSYSNSSANTVNGGRALFSADFLYPTAASSTIGAGRAAPPSLGNSSRRMFVDSADSSSLSGISGNGRPQTAPPRLRTKEIETSDLLYSKKMDTSVRTSESTQPSSSRRARSSMDCGQTAASNISSSSATAGGARTKASSSRRSTIGIASTSSSSVSSSFLRSTKATRAQWK